ncbi:hypothetical protein [Candidatus Magnetaquicoccus inordinatus]|uniref:hypothetical protein n=1 Tax=Candidatus Magnetaquicoccus inordinatus TaxID=2496818 RepID=UPI00102C41DC|nr:hypothetical protein [Candidatus Magnetaquicoccus inordinatus]
MRITKSVDLGAGRTVILHELRPKDVLKFLRSISQDLKNTDLFTLLTERLPQMLILLEGENIVPPAGETLEDLSLSECEQVWMVFREMHPLLFLMAGEMLKTALLANFQTGA